MEYAIEIKNLCKEYGSKRAVNELNLKIGKGCLFALLGVNGAGKTTTIKMLTGLAKPSSGDALIWGHSIVNDLDVVKQISNVSPQDVAVAPNLTVKENLEFVSQIYGKSKRDARQKEQEMVELFGLQEVEQSKAKTLSGGWQRKLSIAMALITEPKVLYLDEPTAGLDVLARQNLWKVIRNLKGKITMVLTTHYMEEAEALADKVAFMMEGQVQAFGTVEELVRQNGAKNLEEAFIKVAEEVM